MKLSTEEKTIVKLAETYKTISLNKLAKRFIVEKTTAEKILNGAVKKGLLTYEANGRRLHFAPTKLTKLYA